MLVVISDLHVTDGSSGDTITAGAFELFIHELKECACAAADRADGTSKPVDRVDVVLLGDIFDLIRSSRWLTRGLMPWESTTAIAPVVDEITDGIIAHNAAAFSAFSSLKNSLKLTDTVSVPVFFHYMVGNHDWFFHLPGPAYNAIRSKVTTALSLSNPIGVFPHDLSEQPVAGELQKLFAEHKLYGRHGDIYDPFNYEAEYGRDHSSLGDCIVVQLLNRFPMEVAKSLGLAPTDPLVLALKEIDNVRPYLMIPGWILGTLRRLNNPKREQEVMGVWKRLVKDFLEVPFVRSHDRPWRMDTVDKLQLALPTLSSLPLPLMSGATSAALALMPTSEDYVEFALRERAIVEGTAEYVVYGHTHMAANVALDVVPNDGHDVEQLYINTGTWRRIHEKCIASPKSLEFVKAHVMTYAVFYKDGERKGRKYEVWSGRLGT